MLPQLSVPAPAPKAIPAIRAVTVLTVVAVAALDVAFSSSHRGIMTLLVAVPAMSLLLPTHHRRPLLTGAATFGAALLLGALEWRDRPIVVAGTLINIALVTLVSLRLEDPRADAVRDDSSAEPGPAPVPREPDAPRTLSSQVGDVRVEMRRLPAPGQAPIRTDFYDLRPTRFGVRLLVAGFTSNDPATRQAAAHLLYHWAKTAEEEPSLAELARRLDAALTDVDGKDAGGLLINIDDDRTATLICCGHPPPVLVTEDTAQPLNVVSPLPPLGRFGQSRADLPIYTTALRLAPGRRLLLHTDDEAGDAAPDVQAALRSVQSRAGSLGNLEPGAFLDRLATELKEREGHVGKWTSGDVLLLLVECAPQALASLARTPEDTHKDAHDDPCAPSTAEHPPPEVS
ncbi:SpoIIE family protein phosphatase [Streptomyces albicerus]|uniref:SpoIIE family protein phosphatase n=1 Tax=Streptomyces albicerus TaxID=2569859 RepID=UPI00124B266B|nr:SpoIIE family protein phosphatase [Streptomyces albicerus]